jgi:hypothetical protein
MILCAHVNMLLKFLLISARAFTILPELAHFIWRFIQWRNNVAVYIYIAASTCSIVCYYDTLAVNIQSV